MQLAEPDRRQRHNLRPEAENAEARDQSGLHHERDMRRLLGQLALVLGPVEWYVGILCSKPVMLDRCFILT